MEGKYAGENRELKQDTKVLKKQFHKKFTGKVTRCRLVKNW